MATLRKKALQLSRSGTPTPDNMSKTDSVVNLTKPSLYGIYKDELLLLLNDQIEINVPPSRNSKLLADEPVQDDLVTQLPVITKVVILALSAFVYNEVSRHIHANLFSGNTKVAQTLGLANMFIMLVLLKFKLSNYVDLKDNAVTIDQVVGLVVQGLVLGVVVPTIDRITPLFMLERVLSSNPNPNRKINVINEVIRSLICFLGISYAVRRLEWSLFLQVLIVWLLLNPALWLMLDGTINGFLVLLALLALACGQIHLENKNLIEQFVLQNPDDAWLLWLWIASFFFCGQVIFGKLGRGLFQ